MLPVPGERREGQLRQMEKQVLDRGVGHEPAPYQPLCPRSLSRPCGGPSHSPRRCPCPNLQNLPLTLGGNRDFADVIKSLEMRKSSWIIQVLPV